MMDREKDGERVRLKMESYTRNSDASLVYSVCTRVMLFILVWVFQSDSKAFMAELGHNPGMSLSNP